MTDQEIEALLVRLVEALERIADALEAGKTDTEEQFQKSVGVRDDG
jgi:hypothetical protein